MVCGVSKHGYETAARYYIDGPIGRIRYFFADPSAKWYMGPQLFWVWEQQKQIVNTTEPGELRHLYYRKTKGENWLNLKGRHFEGRPSAIAGLERCPWAPAITTPPQFMVPCNSFPDVVGLGGVEVGGVAVTLGIIPPMAYLTVKLKSGLVVVLDVVTLEFDDADGFFLEEAALGVARAKLKRAAWDTTGVIDKDVEQSLGKGRKIMSSVVVTPSAGVADVFGVEVKGSSVIGGVTYPGVLHVLNPGTGLPTSVVAADAVLLNSTINFGGFSSYQAQIRYHNPPGLYGPAFYFGLPFGGGYAQLVSDHHIIFNVFLPRITLQHTKGKASVETANQGWDNYFGVSVFPDPLATPGGRYGTTGGFVSRSGSGDFEIYGYQPAYRAPFNGIMRRGWTGTLADGTKVTGGIIFDAPSGTPWMPPPPPPPPPPVLPVLSLAGTGGVEIGGNALIATPGFTSGSGGVEIGGAGELVVTAPVAGSGGVEIGGNTLIYMLGFGSRTGGVEIGGVAEFVVTAPVAGSGGVEVGGEGDVSTSSGGGGGLPAAWNINLPSIGVGTCPDCGDLVGDYLANLTTSDPSPIWASDPFPFACVADVCVWSVTILFDQINVYLVDASTGSDVLATWTNSLSSWDGVSPLPVFLLSGTDMCDWPSTITLTPT